MDRRSWFRRGLKDMGRYMSGAVESVAHETGARVSGGKRYLRPPGASVEAAFLLACERCHHCAEACPTGTIRFLTQTAGAALGTPYLNPELAPCILCLQCTAACPSGALLPMNDWRKVNVGRAVIDTSTCWAHRGGYCDVCYGVCPLPDEAIIVAGGRPAIVSDACTGCGQCAYVCPSTPNSISIVAR